MENETKKPVRELKAGSVVASLWKNEHSSGPRYAVTFRCLYKKEGIWKKTQVFTQNDLGFLAELARQAEAQVAIQRWNDNKANGA